jgi:hypothetical protein
MEREPQAPAPPQTPAPPPPFDPDLDLIGDMHRGEEQAAKGDKKGV